MTLGWVVFGTVAQAFLAFFLFMVVVFSSSSIANLQTLTRVQNTILDLSLYALPASCILSAVVVIYCYRSGGSPSGYWWHALPIALTIAYLVFATHLSGQGSVQ